jgi:hypothetical protein
MVSMDSVAYINALFDYEDVFRRHDNEKLAPMQLGKDQDKSLDRELCSFYGTADGDEIIRITLQFARLMAIGSNNTQQLRLIAQSPQGASSRIAVRLLELGEASKRFRFVERSAP